MQWLFTTEETQVSPWNRTTLWGGPSEQLDEEENVHSKADILFDLCTITFKSFTHIVLTRNLIVSLKDPRCTLPVYKSRFTLSEELGTVIYLQAWIGTSPNWLPAAGSFSTEHWTVSRLRHTEGCQAPRIWSGDQHRTVRRPGSAETIIAFSFLLFLSRFYEGAV